MPGKHKQHKTNHRSPHLPKGVKRSAFEKVYWPYLPLIAVFSIGIIFSSISGRAADSFGRASVLAYSTSMSIGGLLSNTNIERSNNGLGNLTINSQLNAAAQAKANDMAARNYWSHNTPDGNPPWIFVDAQGYAYEKLGENLAAGFDSESATIAGWMASPSHKANMLDGAYSQVGFGFTNKDNYVAGNQPMTIVVAFYGKPQVIPGPVAAPSTTPPPPVQPPAQPATPEPTPPPPAPVEPKTEEAPKQADNKPEPVNNTNQMAAVATPVSTSGAQLLLSATPLATIATAAATILMFGLGFLWASKHLVVIRRTVTAGEAFVVHHPVIDISLLCLLIFAYTMTRTAGFIQ